MEVSDIIWTVAGVAGGATIGSGIAPGPGTAAGATIGGILTLLIVNPKSLITLVMLIFGLIGFFGLLVPAMLGAGSAQAVVLGMFGLMVLWIMFKR